MADESHILPPHLRVLRPLGRGAMGDVLLAEDDRLGGRRVAVKRIRADLLVNPDIAERFLREARATAAIDHPNVITVHRLERDRHGNGLLVMEYVEGETLAEYVERLDGRLRGEEAVRLLLPVMEGLATAHEAGVLHRDLKPANILLERETHRPVLSDFGLARLFGARTLTRTGDIIGSPAYMSPEQAAAEPIDVRSEVYAMAATLYRIVTGRPPFHDEPSVHGVLTALTEGERPASAAALRPDLDTGIVAVLEKAMDPHPGRRHPSVTALADDLRAALRGEAPSAASRRSPAPLLVGTIGVLLLGTGILAWSPWTEETSNPTPETETAKAPVQKEGDDTDEATPSTTPAHTSRIEEPPTAWPEFLALRTSDRDRKRALHSLESVSTQRVPVPRIIDSLRTLVLRPDPAVVKPLFEIHNLGPEANLTAMGRGIESPLARSIYFDWLRAETVLAHRHLLSSLPLLLEETLEETNRRLLRKRQQGGLEGNRGRELGWLLYTLADRVEGIEPFDESVQIGITSGLAFESHAAALAQRGVPAESEEEGRFLKASARLFRSDHPVVKKRLPATIAVMRAWSSLVRDGTAPVRWRSFRDASPLFMALFTSALLDTLLEKVEREKKWEVDTVTEDLVGVHATRSLNTMTNRNSIYPGTRDRAIILLCRRLVYEPDGDGDVRETLQQARSLLTSELRERTNGERLVKSLVAYIDAHLKWAQEGQ